jgi:3D (Asp-Asp-Asp) domain-containing protein
MTILRKLSEEIVPLSGKQGLVLLVVIACIFQFTLFFSPALADEAVNKAKVTAASALEELIINDSLLKEAVMDQEAAKLMNSDPTVTETEQALPAPVIKIIRTSTHTITAYNSEAAQTDDTPCITANGFDVCAHNEEDTIAANFLKFGTKVQIPELFGDRIFIVRDRMNKRYSDRVDVWMKEKSDARQFGVKVAKIQVIVIEETPIVIEQPTIVPEAVPAKEIAKK